MYKPKEIKRLKILILDKIAQGKSVDSIKRDGLIGSTKIVFEWLHKDAQFRKDYATARLLQLQFYGERIQKRNESMPKNPTKEQIMLLREKNDTDKWIAARMLPKVYGSNTMTNIQINNFEPVTGVEIVDIPEEIKPIDKH